MSLKIVLVSQHRYVEVIPTIQDSAQSRKPGDVTSSLIKLFNIIKLPKKNFKYLSAIKGVCVKFDPRGKQV